MSPVPPPLERAPDANDDASEGVSDDVPIRALPAWRPGFRWFAAEVVVIVAGVLIALALDAWWSDLQRSREAAVFRQEVEADVRQTRAVIDRDLASSREYADRIRGILGAMSAPDAGRDSVLATVGGAFLLKKWEPVNDTYEEALASGRVSLLDDAELRLALSRYHSQIAYVDGFVDWITEAYYGQHEPWLVDHTAYSEIAYTVYRNELVEGPFRTDFDALARSRELWNLLTFRLELETGFQGALRLLDERAAAVLDVLDGSEGK